jgi:hypothetical protein
MQTDNVETSLTGTEGRADAQPTPLTCVPVLLQRESARVFDTSRRPPGDRRNTDEDGGTVYARPQIVLASGTGSRNFTRQETNQRDRCQPLTATLHRET